MNTKFVKRTSTSRELVVVQAQAPGKPPTAMWLAIPLAIITASIVLALGLDTLLK